MANRPLILEAANLFCGADPTASNHLILTELRLPALERNYVDHAAGGSPVAIEVDTHINRMEATFTLAGWQPQIFGLIGAGDQQFSIYGVLRDRVVGRADQAMAIIQGRLGRATPSPYTQGVVQSHEYAIRGIMYYELSINYVQMFRWDFYEANIMTASADDPIALLQRLFGSALGW